MGQLVYDFSPQEMLMLKHKCKYRPAQFLCQMREPLLQRPFLHSPPFPQTYTQIRARYVQDSPEPLPSTVLHSGLSGPWCQGTTVSGRCRQSLDVGAGLSLCVSTRPSSDGLQLEVGREEVQDIGRNQCPNFLHCKSICLELQGVWKF